MKRHTLISLLTLFLAGSLVLPAQRRGGPEVAANANPAGPLKDVQWRQIGPFRGGRVLAVAGVTSQPEVYYFGAVGGGIFKTTDAGASWIPVADGQLANGDVGAIAVAESD